MMARPHITRHSLQELSNKKIVLPSRNRSPRRLASCSARRLASGRGTRRLARTAVAESSLAALATIGVTLTNVTSGSVCHHLELRKKKKKKKSQIVFTYISTPTTRAAAVAKNRPCTGRASVSTASSIRRGVQGRWRRLATATARGAGAETRLTAPSAVGISASTISVLRAAGAERSTSAGRAGAASASAIRTGLQHRGGLAATAAATRRAGSETGLTTATAVVRGATTIPVLRTAVAENGSEARVARVSAAGRIVANAETQAGAGEREQHKGGCKKGAHFLFF